MNPAFFQEISRLSHEPNRHFVAVLIVFIDPIIRNVPLQHRPIFALLGGYTRFDTFCNDHPTIEGYPKRRYLFLLVCTASITSPSPLVMSS